MMEAAYLIENKMENMCLTGKQGERTLLFRRKYSPRNISEKKMHSNEKNSQINVGSKWEMHIIESRKLMRQ